MVKFSHPQELSWRFPRARAVGKTNFVTRGELDLRQVPWRSSSAHLLVGETYHENQDLPSLLGLVDGI